MNRGWIDRSAKRVPTYQEVTSKSIKKSSQGDAEDSGSEDPENQLPTVDPDIDEDDFEEIVDRFESSYNFRFEEPQVQFSYSRIVQVTCLLGMLLQSKHIHVIYLPPSDVKIPLGRMLVHAEKRGRKPSY